MKSHTDFKLKESALADDAIRKPAKLDPIRKSGKERRSIYGGLEDDEDEELDYHGKRESVLDYFDDGDEDKD